MDKVEFKQRLSDLLFLATSTNELSVERVLEVTDKIADDVVILVKQYEA